MADATAPDVFARLHAALGRRADDALDELLAGDDAAALPFVPVVRAGVGRADIAAVRRYFEMWNRGDFTAADDLLDAAYVDHAHPELVGPSVVEAVAAWFRSRHPRATVTLDAIAGDGELVAARTTTRGVPGTPRRLALFRVRAGKIVEHWIASATPPA
ncbi:MAG TPA: nuclear transport factor 2 family protein [Minicystis sp.]|nr:nuclear transport factor 2 family protein [Minicystis sp.]